MTKKERDEDMDAAKSHLRDALAQIAPGESAALADHLCAVYRLLHGLTEEDKSPLAIYAWVGQDEMGSGVVGLKQARTPAGMIPLAAMAHHLDRLAKLLPAMEEQAKKYGRKIRLCRFEMVAVAAETQSGNDSKKEETQNG